MPTQKEVNRRARVEQQAKGQAWEGIAPEQFVCRIKHPDFDGWRYQRAEKGDCPPVQVYFSCFKYGGELEALQAANEFARQQDDPDIAFGVHTHNKKSKFGFVGVFLTRTLDKRGRVRGVAWSARWIEAGRGQQGSNFSISIYGYEGAFLNAAWERIRAVGNQPNLDPNCPPEPPDWLVAWMIKRGLSN